MGDKDKASRTTDHSTGGKSSDRGRLEELESDRQQPTDRQTRDEQGKGFKHG